MGMLKYFVIALIFLSFAVAIYYYPQMPDKIASHWNAQGEVNGYMDSFWGLFFVPILLTILAFIFMFIPKIDPLHANYKDFKRHYDHFIFVIIGFMFYIYLLTIWWNLGNKFNLIQYMIPAFTVLFYFSGVLIQNARPNWFVGIRTPWTLSSEKVWNKTHKLGGKLFKAVGIISLLGILFPSIAIWLILAPIIATVIWSFIYSYLEFRKEKKMGIVAKRNSRRNN
jgi:uncharacterized membrane protein